MIHTHVLHDCTFTRYTIRFASLNQLIVNYNNTRMRSTHPTIPSNFHSVNWHFHWLCLRSRLQCTHLKTRIQTTERHESAIHTIYSKTFACYLTWNALELNEPTERNEKCASAVQAESVCTDRFRYQTHAHTDKHTRARQCGLGHRFFYWQTHQRVMRTSKKCFIESKLPRIECGIRYYYPTHKYIDIHWPYDQSGNGKRQLNYISRTSDISHKRKNCTREKCDVPVHLFTRQIKNICFFFFIVVAN